MTSPGFDPPRRAFGPASRPSSTVTTTSIPSASNPKLSTSPTLRVHPPAEPQRTRSASSSSSEAFETAATKAQAWLQGWAPRGEGRGREFLSHTLNGVAGVASTVSHGINGAVTKGVQLSNENFGKDGRIGMGGRPSSYAGPSTSSSDGFASPEPPFQSRSPPGPTHTSSTPAIPTGRRIPQPSNLARLGGSSVNLNPPSLATSPPPPSEASLRPPTSHPNTSSNVPYAHRPTSSTSSLTHFAPTTSSPNPNLHGPSHLNPNVHVRTNSTSHSRSQSFGTVAGRTPSLSRSSSTATGGRSVVGRSLGMPYKIGFQPAGVKNDRSEEFAEARQSIEEERDKEEGRLGRRWAKLVDLHFNPATANTSTPPSLSRSSSSQFSLTSFDKRRSLLSIDGALDALKGPREVWKGVKTNIDPRGGPVAEENRKRAAEQAIVKWEDDAEAKKCRICQASFNLSNRKHHCRLCGRIVCSLPPTPPALLAVQLQLFAPADSSASTTSQAALPPGTRREKCSLLLVADWKTGRGEEVDEGFVGWMQVQNGDDTPLSSLKGKKDRRKSRLSTSSTISSGSIAAMSGLGEDGLDKTQVPLAQQPKEVQVKGARACRECWATVSRKQKIEDRQRPTGFARLYQMLRTLQAEIEDAMPDFEEQMVILTSSVEAEEPGAETIALHKHLITLFTQYEHLSKRISSRPVKEGSSQQTVQSAVARSAAKFLAKEMLKIQALPKLQKHIAEMKRQGLNAAVIETTLAEQLKLEGIEESQAVDVAVLLQPLLEQEAQLEAMIADANAQRKYEDGKALTQALGEIRSEIATVTQKAIS